MTPGLDELVEQVRKALRHLDDPLYLENLSLARELAHAAGSSDLSGGQLVRRTLRLAITSMEPSSLGEGTLVDATTYQVLYRYAILRKAMTAIAQELGMSVRTGYYALSRATEALARVAHDLIEPPRFDLTEGAATASSPSQRVRDELLRLASGHPQDVDLCQLLGEVLEDLAPLARQSGVELHLLTPTSELHVAVKRVLLRQAIINLLSWLVTSSGGGRVTLRLTDCGEMVVITVDGIVSSQIGSEGPDVPRAMARRISKTLGLRWSETRLGQRCQISVEIPRSSRKHVLVVDDNEGVIALIQRYLHSQPYVVWGARDGKEALDLLAQIDPDASILDIMLPNQDGWEVLGMLRETCQATGRDVPVVVCSIINDPRLARALGANAFLHKPITRAGLLQALDAVTSSL